MSGGMYAPKMNVKHKIKENSKVHIRSIDNKLNVNPSSLKIKSSSKSKELTLTFTFDALIPCFATVLFGCREKIDHRTNLTRYFRPKFKSARVFFKAGRGQRFACGIDPAGISFLKDVQECEGLRPLVLILEGANAKVDPSKEEEQNVKGDVVVSLTKAQINYCSVEDFDKPSVKCAIDRQKIHIDNFSFEIFEIYGIEEESDTCCVVCMTDKKDTVVVPCRHMCLCYACASELRLKTSKCPICRNTINAFMYVKREGDLDKDGENSTKMDDTSSDDTPPPKVPMRRESSSGPDQILIRPPSDCESTESVEEVATRAIELEMSSRLSLA